MNAVRTITRKPIWFVIIMIVALALTACASGAAETIAVTEELEGDTDVQPVVPQGGSSGGTGGEGFSGSPLPTAASAGGWGGVAEATEEAAAEDEYNLPPAGAERGGDAAAGVGGSGGGPAEAPGAHPPAYPTPAPQFMPPPVEDQQFAEPLQAGEIDDNVDFGKYLQYRLDFQSFLGYPVHDLDVIERHIIRVTNGNGRPVLGADVAIYDGQNLVTTLHTPATGMVYFFPHAYSSSNPQQYEVMVEKGQTSTSFTLTRSMIDALWDVELEVPAARPPVNLDVLFLIDATGSMGDEIDELKNNIMSISAQISALPSQPDVRFGMVAYRDRGDQFVTQVYDFTSNVQDFQQSLMNLRAAGGMDDPESLNQALYESLNYVDWRGGETVQLVFLVADAPPHLDYPQDYSYGDSLLQAAQMGVKIQPIASRLCEHRETCAAERRAYQEQAEYIFRQMAQFTGGKYIFLAYEDTPQTSGEPGTESHVSEDDFTVQDLDALVVRLIMEELAALDGGQQ